MSKVLLHICCGPCASYPVPRLREEGYELMGYFYNPNIHPFTEYQKRKEALEEYAQKVALKVVFEPDYKPADYFHNITYRESRRCLLCYQMRLEQAARVARKGKFDYFTTTLLVSKYQKHELIREIGEAIGEKYEVPFLYRDFREGFRQTGIISREMGLYRQQYCGCLYSEMERYQPSRKKS
ncbi:MAG: epoxyqueuosine reductase QueH [Syntrophomonas sp.]|uniref:epoxyqueuosine reductase QueH n=1 Tax=Syntrophomonas sp. TaxID=2053627 RepID=UPI002638A62B|nr:epoxyqueuosine reductase QueH [Syntrophomonas sp.]MDD2511343.1 epoxyqueuosine reductase QueH [Syntrophomonas sp.]MDD3880095.1 epoxyqueuosine reductase QueH [Syntrophomonas sp.]MDD4627665.1 epoxyqueuosine reductase QueH [Syntrophomonas sp.]